MNRSTGKHLLRTASLVLAVLLAGCATQPQWPAVAVGDANVRLDRTVLLDRVPFHPQERYQCGPASLAMMLNSRGLNRDPDDLKELVYLPGRRGSLQVELVAAARSHDLLVYPLDGTLDTLLTEVAAGNPVLVMQNLRLSWWPQWHFAVVIGFDADDRRIILHTDTREAHRETVEVFMATWSRAENWAVVMVPPDELPATAEPVDYLIAASDLESTNRFEAANQAYQTAEQAWPDQPAAVLGQGNIAYSRQDWAAASRHYQRLTNKFPDVAAGWNNLAHALAQQGCAVSARNAAACAAQLNPARFGNTPDLAAAPASESCPVIRCPVPAAD